MARPPLVKLTVSALALGVALGVVKPGDAAPLRPLNVLATVQVRVDGNVIVPAFGAVWAASSNGLIRLSRSSAQAMVVLPVATDDVAVNGNRLFALEAAGRRLVELTPRRPTVIHSWSLSVGATSLVVDDRAAYVAFRGTPATVERIDLRSGANSIAKITGSSLASRGRRVLALGGGRLWLTDGSRLYRLNPAHLAVHDSIARFGIADLWFGADSLWAASDEPNSFVDRIDSATGNVIARDTFDAIQIAFSPRKVWLAAADGPTGVDATTATGFARALSATGSTGGPAGIAVVGRELWALYPDVHRLQRIRLS